MHNDYSRVDDAIETGADPVWLCGLCPWDRSCLDVPQVDDADIIEAINRSVEGFRRAYHDENNPHHDDAVGMAESIGGLDSAIEQMTSMAKGALGGAKNETRICPVLSARLRTSEGRRLMDAFKDVMQDVAMAPMVEQTTDAA